MGFGVMENLNMVSERRRRDPWCVFVHIVETESVEDICEGRRRKLSSEGVSQRECKLCLHGGGGDCRVQEIAVWEDVTAKAWSLESRKPITTSEPYLD